MSLKEAMWKITAEHTCKLAYVFVRQPASRIVRENAVGLKVPRKLDYLALQLGWREESIRVVAAGQGRRGGIAEGRGGYEQMLNDIADGKVGAVFFLGPSRAARDIADWHNFIKICQQAGTLVVDEQSFYNPGDADGNMMLTLMALMAEAEQTRITDRLRGAKPARTAKGARGPSPKSAMSKTKVKNVILDPQGMSLGTTSEGCFILVNWKNSRSARP